MCQVKVIVLIGFLVFLESHSAVSQWTNICNDEADGTRLALPMNCRRFVVCAEREVTEIRSCPRGLHFNSELGECDFQWRTKCIGSSLFAADVTADECTCTCCADECNTTDPDISTTYLTEETTNSVTETTIVSNSSASTTSAPSATTSQPNENPLPVGCLQNSSMCTNQDEGALIQIDGVCTSYIQCSHGCAVEMPCPSGLYFDQDTGACNHPLAVNCTPANPDAELAGPSGVSCNNQSVCAGQHDGAMFADPDSNGFIICQCQCPIARSCGANTKFNQTIQACDWVKASPATLDVICPDNLVYNATSNECDYAANYVPLVKCDNDSDLCKNQPEGTLLPVEGFCNKFYKCNFNCAVVELCPNNLIYDKNIKGCNYPQYVDCPWEYTPPSGPNAGPSGISCESNGRCLGKDEGTYLPSLTNCSAYAVCQCECEIPRQCAAGLYWDETISTCNYAKNVKCSL